MSADQPTDAAAEATEHDGEPASPSNDEAEASPGSPAQQAAAKLTARFRDAAAHARPPRSS